MTAPDAWVRFRQRITEGNQQHELLKAWQTISGLTALPVPESLEQLRKLLIEQMDDHEFQTFRNAMILVNSAYMERAGLVGIQDPAEWERRYNAYLAGGDPEARQYENLFHLRVAMDRIRPHQQSPPYDAEELDLGRRCNELFNKLATVSVRATPRNATPEVARELQVLIDQHRALLADAKPENRARRQVLEAIANLAYTSGRVYLILKDYSKAAESFESALEQFETLNEGSSAQMCRQQLASLRNLAGNVDDALQANLELLTSEANNLSCLDRASALVSQLQQVLNANDKFEGRNLLQSALNELKLYPDPHRFGVNPAFATWVEMIPGALKGNDFLRELARVIQLYSATLGARAIIDSDPQAEQELNQMKTLLDRMFKESVIADSDLQQRFTAAAQRPLAARSVATAS
jgi:HPt (histidine-containing phosphotransfer) domain-containing protein